MDGGAPIPLKVKDVQGSQLIKLPKPVKGRTLVLKVDKAIAGKKYADLVLSELRLVDAQGPVTVRTPDVEERRKAFQTSLADTSLARIVDRSWHKRCEDKAYVIRTLKVRSDHTFTLTNVVGETGGSRPEYDLFLDGSWAVKKEDEPWSTLELVGRQHRVDTKVVKVAGEWSRRTRSLEAPEAASWRSLGSRTWTNRRSRRSSPSGPRAPRSSRCPVWASRATPTRTSWPRTPSSCAARR